MSWIDALEDFVEKIERAHTEAFSISYLQPPEPIEIKPTPSLERVSDCQLCQALKLQVEKMKKARLETSMDALEALRRPYFLVAIEINRRGRIAPAFRPKLSPYRPGVRAAIDDLHSCDLQIIDLHWLKCRGRTPDECGKSTAPIFASDELDLALAWEFANKPWQANKKRNALRLSPSEEWVMGIFRGSDVRKLQKTFKLKADQLRQKLSYDIKSKRLNRQWKDVQDWPDIWRARAVAAHITNQIPFDNDTYVSPTEIARIWSLMTGKPRERRTTATRVKRLLPFC